MAENSNNSAHVQGAGLGEESARAYNCLESQGGGCLEAVLTTLKASRVPGMRRGGGVGFNEFE